METPLNPSHIATIADVALAAKVSIATVSRVKNTSHLVSEEKRRRVFAAMEDLGYPRESQSSAEKNEAQIILLVCSGFHLLEDILEGIIEGAEGLNTEYRVTITYTGFTNEGYRRALELARMLPPELLRGIIFYNNMCDDLSIWAEFQKYPLVQIGEHIKSGNCFAVLTNDREAMSELTRLLICKGHRRFVFLSNTYGENRYHFCIDREAGFRASLEEANIPVDENHFFYGDYTPEGGAEAARQIAAMDPRPDAVVCVSDTMAIGCLKELHRLQISIPGEIAVTGFDDMEYSEALYPSLTTVRQAYGEIGAEAMRTLDALATRQIRSGRVIYVQHTLIERESG